MLDGLKANDDGSLTISIQKDSPGKDKEPNWLPAPDGPVYVVMRITRQGEFHRNCLPLAVVDLGEKDISGGVDGGECEGMCGL